MQISFKHEGARIDVAAFERSVGHRITHTSDGWVVITDAWNAEYRVEKEVRGLDELHSELADLLSWVRSVDRSETLVVETKDRSRSFLFGRENLPVFEIDQINDVDKDASKRRSHDERTSKRAAQEQPATALGQW